MGSTVPRVATRDPKALGGPDGRTSAHAETAQAEAEGGRRAPGRRSAARCGGAPSSWSSRRAPAARAIATTGWITVVSGGVVDAATPQVVVADHRDVAGHVPAQLGEHGQRTGGHQVGGDEDRVEVGVLGEQRGAPPRRRTRG